jgi:hypothetical protein
MRVFLSGQSPRSLYLDVVELDDDGVTRLRTLYSDRALEWIDLIDLHRLD